MNDLDFCFCDFFTDSTKVNHHATHKNGRVLLKLFPSILSKSKMSCFGCTNKHVWNFFKAIFTWIIPCRSSFITTICVFLGIVNKNNTNISSPGLQKIVLWTLVSFWNLLGPRFCQEIKPLSRTNWLTRSLSLNWGVGPLDGPYHPWDWYIYPHALP